MTESHLYQLVYFDFDEFEELHPFIKENPEPFLLARSLLLSKHKPPSMTQESENDAISQFQLVPSVTSASKKTPLRTIVKKQSLTPTPTKTVTKGKKPNQRKFDSKYSTSAQDDWRKQIFGSKTQISTTFDPSTDAALQSLPIRERRRIAAAQGQNSSIISVDTSQPNKRWRGVTRADIAARQLQMRRNTDTVSAFEKERGQISYLLEQAKQQQLREEIRRKSGIVDPKSTKHVRKKTKNTARNKRPRS